MKILLWACQIYLAYLFFRSAYNKVTKYELVKAEFERWGYPFPGQITFFLIVVWILGATTILFPQWSVFPAFVLLAFMTVAFATLVFHGEYRRLVEPGLPMALSLFIVIVRFNELLDAVSRLK